jgi:hypothetical protein
MAKFKEVIENTNRLEALIEKLNESIKQQAGSFKDLAETPKIKKLVEYPLFKITYKVQKETRRKIKSVKHVKDDFVNTKPQEIVFENYGTSSEKEFDVWSLEGEKVEGFIHFKKEVEIDKLAEVVNCDKCRGSGNIRCPVCNGKGSITCKKCRGDGKIQCPDCRGSRKMPCKECEGMGEVFDSLTQKKITCPQCSGKGSVNCLRCETGSIPCQECNKVGNIPCKDCSGKGGSLCLDCNGKGKVISGYAVEMVYSPEQKAIDISNDIIPQSVMQSGEFSSIGYEKILDVASPGSDIDLSKYKELNEELISKINELKTKTTAAQEKIISVSIVVEKKTFYAAEYMAGEDLKTVWMASDSKSFIVEKKIIHDVLYNVLDELKHKIKEKNFTAALNLCSRLVEIAYLKEEVLKLKKEVNLKILMYSIAGALGGVFVSSVFIGFDIYRWKSSSLHVLNFITTALFVNLLLGLCLGVVLYFLKLELVKNFKKRIIVGFTASLIISSLIYTVVRLGNFDYALYLDKKQMQSEFKSRFNAGLEIIVQKTDIEFMETLINKYKPAGVDVTQMQKSLLYLKEKKRKDSVYLEKIDKIYNKIKVMAH